MKISLKNEESQVMVSNQGEKVNFKISSNTAKLFYMLRDGFYSKKIQTMVQEYMSNARDAHTMANNPNPFHVILPTDSNPSLIIEDFGVGMNREELIQFASYLDSAKDNLDEPIGGFGIGGKIAFAITDSFVVVSRKNGEERTFFANLAEVRTGVCYISEAVKTNKPNGTQVIIPIENKDFDEVKRSVARCLSFWKPQPLVINEPSLNEKIKDTFSTEILSGSNYSVNKVSSLNYRFLTNSLNGSKKMSRLVISVGGVPYELSNKMIEDLKKKIKKENDFLSYLLQEPYYLEKSESFKYLFFLNLSSKECRVASTRESVVDSEDNLNSIALKIEEMIQDTKKQINNYCLSIPTKKAITYISEWASHMDCNLNVILPSLSYKNKETIYFDNYFAYLKIPSVKYELSYVTGSKYSNSQNNLNHLVIFDRQKINSYYKSGAQNEYPCYLNSPEVSWKSLRINLKNKTNLLLHHRIVNLASPEVFEKIKKLFPEEFLHSLPAVNKSKKINQKEARISKINTKTFQITNDNYFDSRILGDIEDLTIDLADLKNKITTTQKEFKKFFNNMHSTDFKIFQKISIDIYIVGEKTFELINDKKDLSSIYSLVEKEHLSPYSSDFLSGEHIFNEKETGFVCCFYNFFSKKEIGFINDPQKKDKWSSGRISQKMTDQFKKLFKKEIDTVQSFLDTSFKKIPYLKYVNFYDLRKEGNELEKKALWKLIKS